MEMRDNIVGRGGGYSLPIILVLDGVIFFCFAVTTDGLEH